MTGEFERVTAALADRYRIRRQIGQGGMATVYLADDLRHGREVAVKILRDDMAATLGEERFLREIQTVAQLSHPHIIPLYDSGMRDGFLFYVMPFIEGESLRALLDREGPLAIAQALQIAREVADGLAYAHGRGVIHRDIKPDNIMIATGHALIADYGIARAMSATAGDALTQSGLSIGTPLYMSPEQAVADPDVDQRSDIYALGCVLYEMLTGEPPFGGPSLQVIIVRHATSAVPSARAVRDTIPRAVDALIARAMAKVPADRFQTAKAFAEAIGRIDLRDGAAASDAAVAPPPAFLAVLPFVNVTRDPDNEFLSDGITEDLIHSLAKVDGLRVVGRTSSFALKGHQEDVRAVGERLQVGSILEGSVRRVGDRLRVTTQLVNVADGFQVWTERYDRKVDDIFAVQDEITQAIVNALRITVLREVSTSPATTDARAYELYLKARYCWNRRTTTGVRQSIGLYEQALQEDPAFGLALAGLGDSWVTLGIYGAGAPAEVMGPAKAAVQKALEVEATQAQALTTRACIRSVYDWDWAGAEEDFRRAIELSPSYPTAYHWYAANHLAPQGRFAEAQAQLGRARTLDPLNPAIGASVGFVHMLEGHLDAALRDHMAVLDLDPQFGIAHYFLGQVYEQQGRLEEAVAAFARARDLTGHSAETVAALAHAQAGRGNRAVAEELLAGLITPSAGGYVSPTRIAVVHAGLGNTAAALANLEQAHRLHAIDLVWLRVWPWFASLRGETRFERLVAAVGLGRQAGPAPGRGVIS
jgi:eukaryotic-like serine/threonine-protein kinase